MVYIQYTELHFIFFKIPSIFQYIQRKYVLYFWAVLSNLKDLNP